jgi:hypothetical protein
LLLASDDVKLNHLFLFFSGGSSAIVIMLCEARAVIILAKQGIGE